MDGSGDKTILLDAGLVGSGSGDGDMLLLVPSGLFGVDTSKFVYLCSKFGVTNNSEDGVEEWYVGAMRAPLTAPEPTTLLLLATGGIAILRRRR